MFPEGPRKSSYGVFRVKEEEQHQTSHVSPQDQLRLLESIESALKHANIQASPPPPPPVHPPPPFPTKRVRARFQAIRLGLCNEIPSAERPASSLVACHLLNKGAPLPKAIGLHWQSIAFRHAAHLLSRSAVTDTVAKARGK